MDKDIDRILKDALTLPPEARGALASLLIESLDAEVDEGVEEAWRVEIERRIKDIESGRAKTIPWEEAKARLMATRKHDR